MRDYCRRPATPTVPFVATTSDRRGMFERSSCVIVVDEILERGVQERGPEAVVLHLPKRLIGRPAVLDHPIDGGHDAGAMAASLTMNVDRLVRRVVHQFEKLRDRLRRRLGMS